MAQARSGSHFWCTMSGETEGKTRLESRQWSADTLTRGVECVGEEMKQELWSDHEDDTVLSGRLKAKHGS